MAAFRGGQAIRNILWTTHRLRHFSTGTRVYNITGNAKADEALKTVTGGRIEGWLHRYEDIVGQTGIAEAQNKVLKAEQDLLDTQQKRRQQQEILEGVRKQLKLIAMELEKVQRGDEKYLRLLTEEHNIIKEETNVQAQIKGFEEQERHFSAELSSAVRESHEKERARNDRTKYWSIIATITGALIGGLGTYISNYLRMRELRGMVKDSAGEAKELKVDVAKVSESIHKHNAQMLGFFKELRSLHGLKLDQLPENLADVKLPDVTKEDSGSLEEITKSIQEELQKHDLLLQRELGEVKKIVSISKAQESEGNVVYVGPELENILDSHNKNIEWKIKMNALWTTTLIYGAFALTVPVLYAIFRGGS